MKEFGDATVPDGQLGMVIVGHVAGLGWGGDDGADATHFQPVVQPLPVAEMACHAPPGQTDAGGCAGATGHCGVVLVAGGT